MKLSKSQLQEVTLSYILANTPRSLYRILIASSAVTTLKSECTSRELCNEYMRVTLKPSKSPLVLGLSYAILIALLSQQPPEEFQPDASCLQWGEHIQNIMEHSLRSTKTSIITANSGMRISTMQGDSRGTIYRQTPTHPRIIISP